MDMNRGDMKYSIVIPAYNEYDNLGILLKDFSERIKTDDIEVIIVNNASTDNSQELLQKAQDIYKFLKVINISVNEGYGNGIKQGILAAKGEYIGWMHADLQNDIADMFKAIDLIKQNQDSKIYVKGHRTNMNIIALIFTYGMALFESLLFKTNFYDINGQPNLFSKNLILEAGIENAPKDILFDLYFYYFAIKNKYKMIRFNSEYKNRLRGESFWNKNILSRFKVSIETMKNSIKLKRLIKG